MTPLATAIGAAVAAVFVGVILALLLASRRAGRDGAWRAVRPLSGEPVMRRWNGQAWETRAMTDEELADFLSREAW